MLPALSDLLFTCLLAAASGQSVQQVATLKGLGALPEGIFVNVTLNQITSPYACTLDSEPCLHLIRSLVS